MSTLNQCFIFEDKLCELKNQNKYASVEQNKSDDNSSNNKYSEIKMDISNFNKFQNINQYDQPNQFYKVGPYLLDKVIGKGNFSVVKLAIHTPTQMQVAIKILHKTKMTKETLEKTYREVHIMKQLSHPYIVRLYQVIDTTDWLFIVMEYALNGELFDHLSQVGRFTEYDARTKFKQILDAVEYCHKMNIVHRDLKAENLLLDKHQNIKLADFGFGSFYENSFLLSTWCGSPPYAAPELFKGEPYIGPKADIWSLGVILYAMVCGTLPFDEPSNIVRLREQVLAGWVRFPYFLSYECEHLIRMILNRSPMKRPTITNINSHKWMTPIFENQLFLMEPSLGCDNEFWNSPSQIYNPQRCNTLGGDSGFDEPINDFCRPSSVHTPVLGNFDVKDFDFNEHVLQIMERCGLVRSEICEELVNKTYGSHTATYLLLSERLRIHRQSYPPQRPEYIRNLSYFTAQTKPTNLTICAASNNQTKSFVSDVMENVNSDFKNLQIIERNQFSHCDRRSPYENMRENETKNHCQTLIKSDYENDTIRNCSSKPSNMDNLENGFSKAQTINNLVSTTNPTPSVIVDVIVPHDQALKECINRNSPLLSFQTNEKIHSLSKNGSTNSPDYLVSYPREVFTSRQNPKALPQPCLLLNAPMPLKDNHIPVTSKTNNDHHMSNNYNNYSTVYTMQPNTTAQVSSMLHNVNANPNHVSVSNNYHQHQSMTSRPIMMAAQSTNTPPGLNNCSYKHGSNNISLQNQHCKPNPSQSQSSHRNQSSDSSLPFDSNMFRAGHTYDVLCNADHIKKANFHNSIKPFVRPEINLKNQQFINQFNGPLIVGANHYTQYNEPLMSPCLLQSPNNEQFNSIVNGQKTFVPCKEIISSRFPTSNAIPISTLAPIDMDCIKFS